MAVIIGMVEDKVAWPIQILLLIISLLPRPQGGERSVGLTCLLYVQWAARRGDDIKGWENNRTQHWDKAVKGLSSLRAAVRRRFLDEAWVETRGFAAGCYWDVEKSYESIKPRWPMEAARGQGMTIKVLALAMRVHLAPRLLRFDKCTNGMVEVATSIIAGRKFSNAFARCIVYNILEDAHKRVGPGTSFRQHVDDLPQNNKGESMGRVARESADAAEFITEMLTESGFNISGKSTPACSCKALQDRVESKLRVKAEDVKVALWVHVNSQTCCEQNKLGYEHQAFLLSKSRKHP